MFALLEPNVNVTVDLQRDEKQQIWKEEKKTLGVILSLGNAISL